MTLRKTKVLIVSRILKAALSAQDTLRIRGYETTAANHVPANGVMRLYDAVVDLDCELQAQPKLSVYHSLDTLSACEPVLRELTH